MRRAVLWGLFVIFARTSPAQSAPNAAAILKEVAETYRAAKQYQLAMDGGAPDKPFHRVFSFRPGQYRLDGPLTENSDVGLTIYDGTTLWFYFPKTNVYAAYSTEELKQGALDPGSPWQPEDMNLLFLEDFRNSEDHANGARFVREDVLQFGGARTDCYVLSIVVDRIPLTWWVDKTTSYVLRVENDAGDTFLTFRSNEPLPEALFKFVPPPNARKEGGEN